jgi:hypothetical protein
MNKGTDDKIGKGIDVALVTLAFLGIGGSAPSRCSWSVWSWWA